MDPIDPWPPADPLGEALHFLRMNGAFYCRSELTAEWGLTLPPLEDYLWFHVVTSGGAWLETDGAEATVPAGRGPRARAARTRATLSAAARRSRPRDPRARAGASERPVRDPRARRRRSADDAASAALCASAILRLATSSPRSRDDPRGGVRARRRPSGCRHPPADGRRGEGAATGRRGGGHAPRRHPRHPGDPLLDRDRPGRAHGLARRAPGPADRPRDLVHPPRARRGRGRLLRSLGSSPCRAPLSRRASRNWSASRSCSTSPAGGCISRSAPSARSESRSRSSRAASATGFVAFLTPG